MTRRAPFDDTISNTPFDTATEVLMAAMLLFLPLAFGATEAWSQEIWYALVAALGLCVLLKQWVYRGAPVVWSWAYVPIVLFVLLVAAQQVPLPRGLLATLSPGTIALRDELLADLSVGSPTLSFYAFATAQQTRMVLAVCVVFVVVLQAYRTPSRLRRLLMIVTTAGAAVTVVAAYQDLTRATLIYGAFPIGHKNAGPFQNYSHFSQFVNLSMGAAAALLLLTVSAWRAGGLDPRSMLDEFKQPRSGFLWLAAGLCVLGPVVVFWSMSRMGIISMLVAAGSTAGLLGWRSGQGRAAGRPGGTFLALGLGVAVLTLLLVIGFDVVYDRLATLRHTETSTGGRVQILRDLTAVYAKFPVLGVGLGTHEFVFPVFSHQTGGALFTHAENEYAQLLEECGAAGLLLAVGFIVLVGVAFVRVIRRPRRPEQFAVFGLGAGLIAVLLHSFSDFGQHVPANATLTAVFSALIFNVAAAGAPLRQRQANAPGVFGFVLRAGALGVFVVGAGWVLVHADVGRRAEAAFAAAQAVAFELEPAGWRGDDDQFRQLLTPASVASDLQPENVTYRHWLNVYRWQAISRDATNVATRRLEFSAEAVEFARQLVDEFDVVRRLCPTFGPSLCVAGQIRSLVLDQAAGDEQIRTAFRLTPYDRTVSYTNGWLAVRRQNWDAAKVAFDRYLRLGGQRWHVVDMYLLASRPDLAFETAKADRWNLDRLAGGLEASWSGQEALVARCRAENERLLLEASDRSDVTPELCVERGRYEESGGRSNTAAGWYQKAVDADYGRVEWRLALARALAASGKREEALRHVRICLRIRPKFSEAESLLEIYSSGRSDDKAGVR